MDAVTTSVIIDAPRERVFEYLEDLANHPEFTDHYLVDWRLTREDSVGRGAGARFRIAAPGNRFGWGDVTFVEVEAPRRIVEAGRSGKGNRIRTLGVYELAEGIHGTTRVQFTLQTESAVLFDKIMAALGGQAWVKRQNAKAMRRLRDVIERGVGSGRRVTIAGR
ncbi:MAG: SRPBCC family protein [Solirubrobacteraceae bacterium]